MRTDRSPPTSAALHGSSPCLCCQRCSFLRCPAPFRCSSLHRQSHSPLPRSEAAGKQPRSPRAGGAGLGQLVLGSTARLRRGQHLAGRGVPHSRRRGAERPCCRIAMLRAPSASSRKFKAQRSKARGSRSKNHRSSQQLLPPSDPLRQAMMSVARTLLPCSRERKMGFSHRGCEK
jgi:hypothetical protein